MLLFIIGSVSAGVKNEVCADCHTDISEMFHNSAHGVYLSDAGDESCESCHGSAVEHIEDGDPTKIINPKNANEFGGDMLCMTCHTSHNFDDWSFSNHKNNGVTCADCHAVHVSADKGTPEKAQKACFTCHGQVKAETMMPSHHPIAEGKIDCIDCHGVHGGDARLTATERGNELCFSCHAEKEGPFVYEHAPVVEDCMMCHSPHGTVADNLLKQSEPALCLNCHAMHFHATVVSVDGNFTTPQAPERAGTSTPESFEEGMTTKCTQCHTAIHGTDLPSQSISTGGNALTR